MGKPPEHNINQDPFLKIGLLALFIISASCQPESAIVQTNETVTAEGQEEAVSIPTAAEHTTKTSVNQYDAVSSPIDGESALSKEGNIVVQEQANADVTFVRAILGGDNTWTFHVTISHPDKGWDDYADGWDVLLPDGTVLISTPSDPFTRLLLHPHVNEQPFTRSQSGLVIPVQIDIVKVRAHDIVDGFGGREVTVDLSRASGADYIVEKP